LLRELDRLLQPSSRFVGHRQKKRAPCGARFIVLFLLIAKT
jgi:hypothetical protein